MAGSDSISWNSSTTYSGEGGSTPLATPYFLESIHPTDLTEISPGSPDSEILADIVFVHGLMGHPVKTWLFGSISDTRADNKRTRSLLSNLFKARKKDGPEPNRPQDAYWPLFLSRVGNFRILTYGYDSHPVRLLSPTNQMSITNHAEQLMTKVNWKRTDCPGRPLIFVCHSLGGILVKAAVVESARSPGSASDLAKSCRVIFFFGTPHMGSSAAQFGLFVKNLISILPLAPNIEDAILKGLSPGSQDLYNITREFNSIIDKDITRRLKICCIQEGSPISGVKGFARKVVPDDSSCLNRREVENKFYVQNSNHMAMCRFSSPDDPGYRDFSSQLAQYIQQIQAEKTAEGEIKRVAVLEQKAEETRLAKEAQRSFLEKLNFPERLLRQHQLDSLMTEPISFDWVWNSELASWLATTEPFFWLNGKPGSGKSTLIHHVAQSENLKKILPNDTRDCSDPDQSLSWLVVYHFFDFRGRDDNGNNFVGFLRSLLFSLVRQDATFASEMAANPNIHLGGDQSGGLTLNEWLDSPRILSQALLEGLKAVLQLPQSGLVLFVDGLDEYEGNKTDLAQFVQELIPLSPAANFKICFSSRFEPPFSTLFQRYPSISVDKENMIGIRRWSEAKMGRIFGNKERDGTNFIEEMVEAITVGSEGVFLWTKFALDEVIDGKTKGLGVNEILNNLRQLPRDMVKLYERIIGKKSPAERKETGLLMALFLGTHRPDDLTLSQLLEAMILAQLDESGDLVGMSKATIDQTALVNFRLRLSHISGGMIETLERSVDSSNVPETRDAHVEPRMHVGMRIMHRTVETYMNSARAREQLYDGIDGSEMKYGTWLRVCVLHIQANWVRWSNLDDHWYFVKVPGQFINTSNMEGPGRFHEWTLYFIPEIIQLQSLSQPFPFCHMNWVARVLQGALSTKQEFNWYSVHSKALHKTPHGSPTNGDPIAQLSLHSHVMGSLLWYAFQYELDTNTSSRPIISEVLTDQFFRAHCAWAGASGCPVDCWGCQSARRVGYKHLETGIDPRISLAIWHDLQYFVLDYLDQPDQSDADFQHLFEYAAARSSICYNYQCRYVLNVIDYCCRKTGRTLSPIPHRLMVRTLLFSAIQDVEKVFSLCPPGSILFEGLPLCQFYPVPCGQLYCNCLESTSPRKPCPKIECRPLFVLCFGPGSYGLDGTSMEFDVAEWLMPRLKFLIDRGEDINGVCGPNNATALHTAVSLLVLHSWDLNTYKWRGTVLFDALVSYNARPDLDGPYGNILEQFWMQIHHSDVLYGAMEDDRRSIHEHLLDECRKFIHRLIDEFHLENHRPDPNGKVPTVEAMRRFGCNYYDSQGQDDNIEDAFRHEEMKGSWWSYELEKMYYQDCNAEIWGTRIVS